MSSPSSSSEASPRTRKRQRQSSPSHSLEEETTNGHQVDPPDHAAVPVPQASAPPQSSHHDSGAPLLPPTEMEGGGLQPTFFGIEPLDEFTRKVGDWIWSLAGGREYIEIEAKIGTLRYKEGGPRIQLPVQSETIMLNSSPQTFTYMFDSDMSLAQHKHYNQLLNSQFVSSQRTPAPIRYSHLYEIDTFRSLPASQSSSRDRKCRVRSDKKTGAIKEVVEKVRLGDLNIFCPAHAFDWRLSISVEVPVVELPPGPGINPRHKDRMSYAHQVVQVDLTQVANEAGHKRHELEVEILNVPELMEEAKAFAEGQENSYDQILSVLSGTVRMLIRNAS